MKRILVVTSATGAGHNSVARSLQQALNHLGKGEVEVDMVDLLAQCSSAWMGKTSHLYAPIIVNCPWLWGAIYNLSNNERFCRFFRKLAGKTLDNSMADLLQAQLYSSILCVHPLCNQIIAEGLGRTKRPVPLVTVITDLAEVHATWVASEVNLYVAPTQEARASLLARGVDPGRVELLGLPIDQRFSWDGADRRQARRRLDLEEETFTLLLTGGGEGAGTIFCAAQAISKAGLPVQLIIACGRNESLRRRLERCFLTVPHRVLGFQDNMPEVMKAVDVVIGKAGALTIGEAIVTQMPFVILGPLPGQERANAEFVRRHNIGLEVANVSSLVRTLEGWIANPGEMVGLVGRAKGYCREWSQAATRVAGTALALIDGGKRGHDGLVAGYGEPARQNL